MLLRGGARVLIDFKHMESDQGGSKKKLGVGPALALLDTKDNHHFVQLLIYAYNYHVNTGYKIDAICTVLCHEVVRIVFLSCFSRNISNL